MKVEVDGKQIRVYWRYLELTTQGRTVRGTWCLLHVVGVADPFAMGVARQFVGDTDSKETARKVTLTKALKAAFPNDEGAEGWARATRRRFWEAYHGRFPARTVVQQVVECSDGPPYDAATATGMYDRGEG